MRVAVISNGQSNNHPYETTDLGLAAYLVIQAVPYLGFRWAKLADANIKPQAFFIFESPPDTILAAWMKEDGDRFRKFRKAFDELREDILGAKR